ncbi:MAG: energy transducer TonB, partial [Paludibacteraceae bacterium]|nr:energy transducer TonB [Paludibacteraceae bacterium]
DIQVLRSVHPSLDAEAVRVISAMPKWVPAEIDGKKIKRKFTFPIVFKMDTDKQDKKGKKKNKKHIKQ